MALAGIATGTKNSTIAPAKTAQDLLNNVMGLSRPSVANVTVPSPSVSSTLGMSSNMPGTSVGIISPLAGSQPQQQYTPHHTRGASSPGGVVVPFLFGSSDPIWSSGLDGGALGYGGVGRSPPSMARTGQQGGSPPGTLRRTSQPGLVGQAQQLQQQQGNLWAGGITTPPLLNQKQPQLQQQQQYSMQNQPQSRSLGPQAGLGLSHQRGISESLVSGAGKRYFGGFPSSPPMQQMPQPQQQEPLQGVLGGRRYDARLEGAQELGGLSGGIGFGISQQQQQQIPSFADTIYSSPPNAGAYYQSQQQQPSRGRGTGSVGNVGGIGLGVGPGVVGERGGLGFNANPGISMASTLKAQQNFAASPYMSSTSIWGQTGFKPSGWC